MPTYRPTNPSGSATGRPAGQGLSGSEETRFRVGRGGGTYRYAHGKDSVNVFIDAGDESIKCLHVVTNTGVFAVIGDADGGLQVKVSTKAGVPVGGRFYDTGSEIIHANNAGIVTLNTSKGEIQPVIESVLVPSGATLIGLYAESAKNIYLLYVTSGTTTIDGDTVQSYTLINVYKEDQYYEGILSTGYVGYTPYCYNADASGFYVQASYHDYSTLGQNALDKRWCIPLSGSSTKLDDVSHSSSSSGITYDTKATPFTYTNIYTGQPVDTFYYTINGSSYGYGGISYDSDIGSVPFPVSSNYLLKDTPQVVFGGYSNVWDGAGSFLKVATATGFYEAFDDNWVSQPTPHKSSGRWELSIALTKTAYHNTNTVTFSSNEFSASRTQLESAPGYSYTGFNNAWEFKYIAGSPESPYWQYTGYSRDSIQDLPAPGAVIPPIDTKTISETIETPLTYIPGKGKLASIYEYGSASSTYNLATDRYSCEYSYSLYVGYAAVLNLSVSGSDTYNEVGYYQTVWSEFSPFGYALNTNINWKPNSAKKGFSYAVKLKPPTAFTISSTGRVEATLSTGWRYFINSYELSNSSPLGTQIISASPCFVAKSELGEDIAL